MNRQCVYFPADNEVGYIWESVLPEETEAFLAQGWSLFPDFSDGQVPLEKEELPYALRKRGRPKKEAI